MDGGGAITARGVGKTFGAGTVALRDVSFDIAAGSFVSFLGPSGCGKSTLLRMTAGLLAPTKGLIELGREPVREPPAGMVYLFQQYTKSLFPWLTVLGNMRFGAASPHARSRGTPFGRAECMEYLRLVGLERHADSYPAQLSGGMQQRLAIARALAARPDVLLMDEPFSALDALTRESLQDLVLRIWGEMRLTIVFVTHDIAEALYLSDRILVLGQSPATVQATFDVPLARPREQIATRQAPEFLAMRRHLYDIVLGTHAAA